MCQSGSSERWQVLSEWPCEENGPCEMAHEMRVGLFRDCSELVKDSRPYLELGLFATSKVQA